MSEEKMRTELLELKKMVLLLRKVLLCFIILSSGCIAYMLYEKAAGVSSTHDLVVTGSLLAQQVVTMHLDVKNLQKETVVSIGEMDSGAGGIDIFKGKHAIVSLTDTESGGGFIGTFDHEGRALVGLSKTDSGGAITTYHENGRELVDLSHTEGGGYLGVYDTEGREMLSLSGSPFGGDLRILDKEGLVSVGLAAFESGGVIAAYNPEDKAVYYLTSSSGSGQVKMMKGR